MRARRTASTRQPPFDGVQHRAAVEPERRDEIGDELGERVAHAQHDRGHPRERPGLAAGAVRVVAAAGREVDEHADHARDDEERDEREQVASVRDRERVDRWSEEPVEQHEAEHRRDRGRERATDRRDCDDHQQVAEQRVLETDAFA